MKPFLLKFVLFSILISTIATGLILISDFAVKQRKGHILRTGNEISIVFAGDSHVECSVNDKLIENSINIAESGEAYLYSYAKIKALLDNNKAINKIFLGFSFGDLAKEKEDSWLFGDISVIEKIKYYNYLLSYDDKSLIIKHNPVSYLKGLMKSVLNNLMTLMKSYSKGDSDKGLVNFGGYRYLVRDKLFQDIGQHSFADQPFEKSVIQEEYLFKISDLCRRRSVRLVLLNTPKYELYNKNVDQKIINHWYSVRNSLPDDSLLDLSYLSLPDSCYGDLTHLNYRGAKIFSEYLNEKLNTKMQYQEVD